MVTRLVSGTLLVGIAIWEILATRCDATSVPDDAAWERASAVVRAHYQPGDLIVFEPKWIDPVGRYHLGDLIPIDMAARMDDAHYARTWELSIRDAHDPELAKYRPELDQTVDGIEIKLVHRQPEGLLADVRDLLPKAKLDNAMAVLELAEVGFEPHRCIQVVPSPNTPARMTFTLPAGKLVGYAGLADVFTRRDIRVPATLEVEVAGKTLTSKSLGVDDGWVRFETPVPAGEVTFVAKATTPQRLVCFAAEVRP